MSTTPTSSPVTTSSPPSLFTTFKRSDRDWTDDGACTALHREIVSSTTIPEANKPALLHDLTSLFFPDRHAGPSDIAIARRICAGCPVREDCLAYSIANYEKVGIWGGMTEVERRKLRRRLIADGELAVAEPEDLPVQVPLSTLDEYPIGSDTETDPLAGYTIEYFSGPDINDPDSPLASLPLFINGAVA